LAFKIWLAYFRATAPISFLMCEHDGMGCKVVRYSAWCEIFRTQPFRVIPRRKFTDQFLIFCNAVACEFSKVYFLPQSVCILHSTFAQISNLVQPYISSRCRRRGNMGTKLTFKKIHMPMLAAMRHTYGAIHTATYLYMHRGPIAQLIFRVPTITISE
jgi:hypothetical protein